MQLIWIIAWNLCTIERVSGSWSNTTENLAGACANQYNQYSEYSVLNILPHVGV